jgi:hypothetical protein
VEKAKNIAVLTRWAVLNKQRANQYFASTTKLNKKSQLLPSCSPNQSLSLSLSLRIKLIVIEAMSDRRFGSSAEKLPEFNDAPSRGEALDQSRNRAASEMMLARPRRYEFKAFLHP